DPDSFELVPRADEVLALLGEDERFKLELPASQIELLTPPSPRVSEAVAALFSARLRLVEQVEGRVRFAAAGAHPFSPGMGELNRRPRYEQVLREYGPILKHE